VGWATHRRGAPADFNAHSLVVLTSSRLVRVMYDFDIN
jgi:hypothetical protein